LATARRTPSPSLRDLLDPPPPATPCTADISPSPCRRDLRAAAIKTHRRHRHTRRMPLLLPGRARASSTPPSNAQVYPASGAPAASTPRTFSPRTRPGQPLSSTAPGRSAGRGARRMASSAAPDLAISSTRPARQHRPRYAPPLATMLTQHALAVDGPIRESTCPAP